MRLRTSAGRFHPGNAPGRRVVCQGMRAERAAQAQRWLLVAVALAVACSAASGQTVAKPNYESDAELSPSTASSGLNLDQSVDGSGAFLGRVFDATGPDGAMALLANYSDPAGWSDTFRSQGLIADDVSGVPGLSLPSRNADRTMSRFIWLADAGGATVYKIDSTKSGAAAVVGAYASRPSAMAGNPVPFAVLSNGDAYVGNAFTFDVYLVGSLTRIQADAATCGPGGAAMRPGTTSTGLQALSWTSTKRGIQRLTLQGRVFATEGLIGSLEDASDACIKGWVDLSQVDYAANLVSIACIAADGFDRVYTVSVNEMTRFGGFIKIYRASLDGSQELLLDSYQDPNQVITHNESGGIISSQSDGPGAPGGSSILIDAWGYLWTGGGSYRKGPDRRYILLRMDTQHPERGMQYFYLDHETNALASDGEFNLWVAGAAGLSLMTVDPAEIGDTYEPNSVGETILLTPGGAPIQLTALQGDCSDDNCCEEGNYNTGVVVARQSGDVYVANECPAGRVLHFDGGGNLVGAGAIRVGTFPASISVDASDHVWVSTMVEISASSASATRLTVIPPGPENTATLAAEVPKPILGAMGDNTGRYTSQPPVRGTWTWVHDTSYTGYDKWNGASARWFADGADQPTGGPAVVNVAAASADTLSAWSEPEAVAIGDEYTELSLPAGRYLKVTAEVHRALKQAPYFGPQGMGVSPAFTGFELVPRNNYPTALCQYRSVTADDPIDQSDTTFGSNANGRICGALLSEATAIDAGSYDPDTAEGDTLVPVELTSDFYSPTQYKLASAAQPYTTATLTLEDAHGGDNQCSAKVNINDMSPPAWKAAHNLANSTRPRSGALEDIRPLCIWPPNLQYHCWLDVLSSRNDEVLPLYDNCAGSVPIQKQVDWFACEDSDPRSAAGDCVLYQDGAKYNLCVLAERRTAYTNTDRVFQATFLVTDGSTPALEYGNWYARRIRLPPLWQYQAPESCIRPEYIKPAGSAAVYINTARNMAA